MITPLSTSPHERSLVDKSSFTARRGTSGMLRPTPRSGIHAKLVNVICIYSSAIHASMSPRELNNTLLPDSLLP